MIIKNYLAWEYFFTHKSTFGVHYRTGLPGQLGLRVAGFPCHWVAGSQNVTQFHLWRTDERTTTARANTVNVVENLALSGFWASLIQWNLTLKHRISALRSVLDDSSMLENIYETAVFSLTAIITTTERNTGGLNLSVWSCQTEARINRCLDLLISSAFFSDIGYVCMYVSMWYSLDATNAHETTTFHRASCAIRFFL